MSIFFVYSKLLQINQFGKFSKHFMFQRALFVQSFAVNAICSVRPSQLVITVHDFVVRGAGNINKEIFKK